MQLVINPTQNINVNLENTFARQNLKRKMADNKWGGHKLGYFESNGEGKKNSTVIFA